jgi:hypothetical protein
MAVKVSSLLKGDVKLFEREQNSIEIMNPVFL